MQVQTTQNRTENECDKKMALNAYSNAEFTGCYRQSPIVGKVQSEAMAKYRHYLTILSSLAHEVAGTKKYTRRNKPDKI